MVINSYVHKYHRVSIVIYIISVGTNSYVHKYHQVSIVISKSVSVGYVHGKKREADLGQRVLYYIMVLHGYGHIWIPCSGHGQKRESD